MAAVLADIADTPCTKSKEQCDSHPRVLSLEQNENIIFGNIIGILKTVCKIIIFIIINTIIIISIIIFIKYVDLILLYLLL